MAIGFRSEHLIMPMPLSIHAAEKGRARFGIAVLASVFLGAVTLLALYNAYGVEPVQIDLAENKFTVDQVGKYGMRAERQARNFEQDAERRTDEANDLLAKAREADSTSEEEEKNARTSAYLAADQKAQIKKILDAGKDQVTRASEYDEHARKLRSQAAALMSAANAHLKTSDSDEARYKINLKLYEKVVDKIHKLESEGDDILMKLHEAGLKLASIAVKYSEATSAKKPVAKEVAKIKAALDAQQANVATLTQEQVMADTDLTKAKMLMDKNQPLIEKANKLKYDSVQEYAAYTQLKMRSAKLSEKAVSIAKRAANLKELIASTMAELKDKRAMFWHYKKRAQIEMKTAESAEKQMEKFREAARSVSDVSNQLQTKADTIRILSQKGVAKALQNAESAEFNDVRS